MKKIIGITGGIGSGKTLMASIINKLGYPIFNSDIEAKLIVSNSKVVRKEIIELFGENSFHSDGSYNTKYVSEIVFIKKNILAIIFYLFFYANKI
jgi:dephospho-CoA kinase